MECLFLDLSPSNSRDLREFEKKGIKRIKIGGKNKKKGEEEGM